MKVTLDSIQKAEKIIRPYVYHTLLKKSQSTSDAAGFEVYLKLENMQKTGSFKIRGAANKLLNLSDKEKKAGVIAASAGNHAQALACMASRLGVKATIVMPEQSALIKVQSTLRFGAQVILKGVNFDEAVQHAQELQKEHGYIFVSAFEDEDVISGQGTLGLEIFKDAPQLDTVFIPIGGGGLLGGTATALKALNPKIKIIGVQAEGARGMADSFKKGKLQTETKPVSTIADGIAIKKPSKIMYDEFISKLCDDVITVTDNEIAQAIVFLMERVKVITEGAGAVSLAALLQKKLSFKPKKALAVLSGGNVDLNMLERIIDRGFQGEGRLVRIVVASPDVPGSLNRLTALIADHKASVLQINHNRVNQGIGLRETIIEFVLETTGFDQIERIKEGFRKFGVTILDV